MSATTWEAIEAELNRVYGSKWTESGQKASRNDSAPVVKAAKPVTTWQERQAARNAAWKK